MTNKDAEQSEEIENRFKAATAGLTHTQRVDVDRYIAAKVRSAIDQARNTQKQEDEHHELRRRSNAIEFERRLSKGIDPTPKL